MTAVIIFCFTFFIPKQANATGCDVDFAYPGIDYKKTVNYKVVFVKYANSPNLNYKDVAKLVDLKETTRYFQEESKNRTRVKFSVHKKVFTIGNSYDYAIGFPSDDFLAQESKFFDSVLAATDSSVDYSKSDGVVIITDYTSPPLAVALKEPKIADGRAIYGVGFNFSSPYLLAHEILHNLGLRDLYIHNSQDYPVGRYSLMSLGQLSEPLLNYEKYSIQWLRNEDIICHSGGNATYKLSTGKKNSLLVIPLGPSEVLAAEQRNKRVLFYYVNSDIPSGRGPISIIKNLKPGKSTDYLNFTIKHLSDGLVEVRNNSN